MKKTLSIVISMIIILSFSACSKSLSTSKSDQASSSGIVSVPSSSTEESIFSEVSHPSTQNKVSSSEYEVESDDVSVSLADENTVISNENGFISFIEGNIVITGAGNYIFSGTLSAGSIIVDALDSDKVYLVLNGASISSSKTAAINSKSSDKTFLVLADGSSNFASDAVDYIYDSLEDDEPNACIFAKNDLTIKGNGSLVVIANFNNGIGTKDDLKIKDSPSIDITAVNNALKGNDSIEIENANLTISSKGDAIKTDNDDDADKGYITINSGVFNLTALDDAITATKNITIDNGIFTIITGGGAGTSYSNSDVSAKGIVSNTAIIINDGNFTLNTNDDAIHSNDTIAINGGDIAISSGDDGIHADNMLTISAGNINITKSYEGIEATDLVISGGTIKIVASDDGVNAAGGADQSSTGTRPGANWGGTMNSASSGSLVISGGFLYVNSKGDGLDANGTISMTGGVVIVSGPTDSGNGALDYDESFIVTGGILIAAGSSGMAQNISSTGTQYSMLVGFNGSIAANTLLNVKASDGTDIITIMMEKQYACLVVCTPQLHMGETYTFSVGGTYIGGSLENGYYQGGTYSGGTTKASVTITSIATNSGVGSQGGGPGGNRH